MAQQRQSGAERLPTRSANNHHPIHSKPAARNRRAVKPFLPRRLSLLFSLALLAALLAASLLLLFLSPHSEIGRRLGESSASASGLSRSAWPKTLRFGRGSHSAGRDSRYWDRDDRRRDQEYTEEEVDAGRRDFQSERRDGKEGRVSAEVKNGALYNEGGRAELDSYQQQYEASLKDGEGTMLDGMGVSHGGSVDEYDNEMDAEDNHADEEVLTPPAQIGINGAEEKGKDGGAQKGFTMVPREVGRAGKVSGSEKKPALKRKPKRTSCEMKFLNSTAQLVEPLENKKFIRFILQYTDVEEMPSGSENWEPRFAGHQSLQEREKSFYAHDQKINCGFVKGPNGSPNTGFDMREDDVSYMGSCHIAVASCIFGNSDNLRIPVSKLITRQSRKHVCFIMFVDEITLQTLLSEGQKMDAAGFIGLWKIVVVKNLPYPDMRRVGKIPKFLAHRLFPSARYSIWLDSKLRLQRDPLLILENVLWRRGYEYAISNHYDRHCVWEEVMQNKKLNKFNHTIIDQQFEFYQADGLKRFNLSDPNRLLPSYVPEGSFIARAHTPMSNLFSCLWFNEVDRFTPRDQLSFAYTYLKLRWMNPDKPFYLNMFKDCERRFIAKLFHHRGEDKRNIPTQQIS